MNPILLLMVYFLAQICFYIVERKYHRRMENFSSDHVYLTDHNEPGVSNFISQVIEYGILNRYSFFGYKNCARANSRIFSSLLMTVFIYLFLASIFRVANIQVSPTFYGTAASALIGFFISSFVVERQILYNKWKHLSDFYQKIMLEEKPWSKESLKLAFALDLVAMEMWSHRSFRKVFREILNHDLEIDGDTISIASSIAQKNKSLSTDLFIKSEVSQKLTDLHILFLKKGL